MKRLLCVWLPNWPIQRLQSRPASDDVPEAADSRTKNNAIILWKDDPRRGRLVVACCHASAALGVRTAMPIAQANEMISDSDRQPRLEKHDPWLDRESLGAVATRFQDKISPLVAIEMLDDHPWAGHPLHQPESLWCDITGVAHLFSGEAGILRAAEKLLAAMGLVGRMAIADSIGAAWALAHYAKTTTRVPGSNHDQKTTVGGFISPAGTSRQQIASLPIESLRLPTVTVATLERLGIETVDQLLRLPKSGLAARLGDALLTRIEQATGEIDEALTIHRPVAEHSYSLELEYPTSDQKILVDRITQLIKKARAGLATCNRGALQLTCRLDLAVHPPLTLKVGLFAPTLDVNHLTALMIDRVENKKLPSCVVRLTLAVTLTGPLRSSQTPLFRNEPCDANTSVHWMSGSAICRLVDSLSGRLGRDAVLGVMIDDDPLPENAFHTWPLTGNGPMAGMSSQTIRSRRTAKGSLASSPRTKIRNQNSLCKHSSETTTRQLSHRPSPDDAMRRPLSLLVRPIPLVVANPSCDHQPPDQFRLEGVVYRIVRYWGPERIETGWWKGPSVARDYFRIETDRGLWWWIFRNLASDAHAPTKNGVCWMLHGRFA